MATTRATRSSARVGAQRQAAAAAETKTTPALPESAPPAARRKRKSKATEDDSTAPATPPAKKPSRAAKTRKQDAAADDDVPDPVSLMAEPIPSAGGPATPKPKPRAVSRLADPNTSHATIVSPETFRVIKGASQQDAAASSSKAQPAQARDSPVLEAACRHLISADARMEPLIARHHCRIFSAEGLAEKIDPFESLVSSMISQLITGAAARTIKARFIRLFADSGADDSDAAAAAAPSPPFPRPSQVAAASVPTIQSAGIARRKAEWIMNLANKFVSGELSAQMMAEAPYEDLRRTLLALPGLGEWTVEMFACFALKRLDVFSVGDLGVQRGMAAFEGRDVARMRSKGGKWKYMARKEMEATAAKFAPYRSVYMWYMWRVEETDISTLE